MQDDRAAELRQGKVAVVQPLTRGPMKKYAIEVLAEHSAEFQIPGASILERTTNDGDGTVVFIAQSNQNICLLPIATPGVLLVEAL